MSLKLLIKLPEKTKQWYLCRERDGMNAVGVASCVVGREEFVLGACVSPGETPTKTVVDTKPEGEIWEGHRLLIANSVADQNPSIGPLDSWLLTSKIIAAGESGEGKFWIKTQNSLYHIQSLDSLLASMEVINKEQLQ